MGGGARSRVPVTGVSAFPEIRHGAVNVGIIADDKGGIIDGHGHLVKSGKELAKRGRGRGQRLGAAIDDNQLVAGIAHDTTPEKTAVVGLVVDDVFVSSGRIGSVAGACVVQLSVGMNPEDKFRRAMREVTDRCSPAAETLGKKVECLRACARVMEPTEIMRRGESRRS